ncbi:ribose 5-phosphate isomerase A [bacterium]|nr:ribose 5-phosphate isomerase A [bacterium]
MKIIVAQTLANRVKSGELIGLGSGTTVELAIECIGKRIAEEGLKVTGVPTSIRVAQQAAKSGFTLLPLQAQADINWSFDGADEVDPHLNLIKGRGGAMTCEKILARVSRRLVIIVSEDKIVSHLGEKHPVPIEVITESEEYVRNELFKLNATEVKLRESITKYGPTITEHGNLILDAKFATITPDLEMRIKGISGVIESGLFYGCTDEVIVARKTGVYSLRMNNGKVSEEKI